MALSDTDVPRTYAQWSACLERLATGLEDEACLDQMRRGELSWAGGVATLFSQRLVAEFNTRLTRCSEHLTRDLRVGMDESLIVRAMLNARHALHFLHRLAGVDAFPDTLRTHLTDEVRKFAQRAQESLENSARTDRSGRLPVLLRNNPLSRYEALTAAPVVADARAGLPPVPDAPASGMRRRNILS